MKHPDQTAVGSRKSSPIRKPRKPHKSSAPALKKATRKKNVLDKDVEQELVRIFGEK